MKLNIFILCLLVGNGIAVYHGFQEQHTVTHISETTLSQLFNQLDVLQNGIEQCNSRFQDQSENNAALLNDSSIFDIRFDSLPEKCKSNTMPKSCAEATACTKRSGIYRILLESYSIEPFLVECDVKTEGGRWILIQRRQDGSEDFYRGWEEYQKGFGNVEGEFFIGLEKLYALTNFNGAQELLILLHDKNDTRKAFYSNFAVGKESESYPLKRLGVYSGDAGDSLTHHLGAKFFTKDRDNENVCAATYTGAWWYKKCHLSNLNGKYGDTTYAKGITWHSFLGYNVSVEHVTMMIRRRTF